MSHVDSIFTDSVIAGWRRRVGPSAHLRYRLLMLEPLGADCPPECTVEEFQEQRTHYRGQMEEFLRAAKVCGLFDDAERGDFIAKLTGQDDANFRSARAECVAAWFLSTRLGLRIGTRPEGQNGPLDLVIDDPTVRIHVEVKAPCRETVVAALGDAMPPARSPLGTDDSDLLRRCVEKAGRQCGESFANLVVLVAELTLPENWTRRSLTKALYGTEQWSFNINPQTDALEDRQKVLNPTGSFLRHLRKRGKATSRRISGVLYLEESRECGASPFDFVALLPRNPFAHKPLPAGLWGEIPQCDIEGESLRWTDRFGEGEPGR